MFYQTFQVAFLTYKTDLMLFNEGTFLKFHPANFIVKGPRVAIFEGHRWEQLIAFLGSRHGHLTCNGEVTFFIHEAFLTGSGQTT